MVEPKEQKTKSSSLKKSTAAPKKALPAKEEKQERKVVVQTGSKKKFKPTRLAAEVVSQAQVKRVGIPVSKMKLSADAIRGKQVHYALGFLTQNRRAANPWLKNLVNSAIANAMQKNNRLKPEQLFIKTVIVNQERGLKRMMPRAMGRGNVIKKRYSQVKIELALV